MLKRPADAKAAKHLTLQAARIAKRLEDKNYEWERAAKELSQPAQHLLSPKAPTPEVVKP